MASLKTLFVLAGGGEAGTGAARERVLEQQQATSPKGQVRKLGRSWKLSEGQQARAC